METAMALAQTTLCPYELSSVRSLTVYVAHNQNLNEANIEAMACAKFNVPRIAELRREDFRSVISFLIDLKIGEIRD
jgi:hypothetical protein